MAGFPMRRALEKKIEELGGIEFVTAHISQGMTIEPGDVIICGTAPGVGFEFLPQKWLQHGDVVECEISGIGRIRNTIKMAGI